MTFGDATAQAIDLRFNRVEAMLRLLLAGDEDHGWMMQTDRDEHGWPTRIVVRCSCGEACWWAVDDQITMAQVDEWRVSHMAVEGRRLR